MGSDQDKSFILRQITVIFTLKYETWNLSLIPTFTRKDNGLV